MQKKRYSSPMIELIELKLTDTILLSVPAPVVSDEYGFPILGKRKPSPKDEIEGDDLFE